MERKKTILVILADSPIIVIVLLAIVIGVGVLLLVDVLDPWRSDFQYDYDYDHVGPVIKIDIETLEVIRLHTEEWRKLGHKGPRFRNPNARKYTMVPVGMCGACGGKIPHPGYLYPRLSSKDRQGKTNEEVKRMVEEVLEECKRIKREYACPKCGEVDPISWWDVLFSEQRRHFPQPAS